MWLTRAKRIDVVEYSPTRHAHLFGVEFKCRFMWKFYCRDHPAVGCVNAIKVYTHTHKCGEITRGWETLNKHTMFMVRALPEVSWIGFFSLTLINRPLNQPNNIRPYYELFFKIFFFLVICTTQFFIATSSWLRSNKLNLKIKTVYIKTS